MIGQRLAVGITMVAAVAAFGTQAATASPGDLLVGQDGASSTVLRVKPGGAHSAVATGSPLVSPAGMDFDSRGTLFVADYALPGLQRVQPRTHAATLYSPGAPFDEPLDAAIGPDGVIYVAEDSNGGQILPVPISSGVMVIPEPISDSSKLQEPFALEIRPSDGMIFVADGGAGLVRVNPRTRAEAVVAGPAKVGFPQGIALTPDGKAAYLASDDTITKVILKTGAARPVSSGGKLDGMYELVLEPSGSLVAASFDRDLLVRVNPAGGGQSQLAGGPVAGPEGLQIEPPRCGGRMATIVGSNKRDVLTGSKFPDVIAGLGGGDVIRGLGGGDIICGGNGRDKMIGGKGGDRLLGGPGKDTPIQ
jgi:DNA-binding beta-propeller fold protein YncE